MCINQQVGNLHINLKNIKIMIRTKNEVYNNRNNTTSRIFIEISESPVDDIENNRFIYAINDYVLVPILDENKHKIGDAKKIINSKQFIMSYAQRDELKANIMKAHKLKGTESEVNKVLMPFALLYLTSIDPIYNQGSNDFELNID